MHFSYFSVASCLVLAACGGGGGSSSGGGGGVNTVINELLKYEGTYYQCDGNDKVKLTLTSSDSNSLNAILSTDVYSSDNCSGRVIGSYRWNTPAVITYQRKTTATMPPITLLPFSDVVDEVTFSVANITAQLTGSGVIGNCVNYSYDTQNGSVTGNSCFDLTFPNTFETGAIYLTSDNQYLVQFSRSNGVLDTDGIFSKNSSFNYNILKLD